tara:strand:+ start:4215 stop:4733 length:519 start_codon:yes stop_codon:yes gene_type:complete
MAIEAILSTIGSVFSGGLGDVGGKIVDTIARQFPEKMSEVEKKQMEIEVMKILNEKEVEMLNAWNDQEKSFQEFIINMEGTASDLKQLPVIGRVILFLRGAFRPTMAFGIAYTDLMVFSGSWNLQEVGGENTDQVWSLLYIMNFLVIGFYFGERAIKNLQPLIEKIFDKLMR